MEGAGGMQSLASKMEEGVLSQGMWVVTQS